ncbi:MAG TPA: TIGR03435 family protein [Bryobacteraceae bacterium]|nr:TIGR03435 family protein [Bryobacteraceae bacterium]
MIRPGFYLWIALATVVCAAESFDVVSVKPNASSQGRSTEQTNSGHVMAENITAISMIEQAFGVRAFQISGGPGWMITDGFDVNATTGTTKDLNDIELQPYWESLLTGRFRMKYHRESKEMQVYSLTVAKSGAKLTGHQGGGDTSTHISNGRDRVSVTSTNISMTSFAGLLGRRLDRMVIDKTGLSGSYDVSVDWAPEASTDTDEASIFTALQDQLGLKLESGKAPVEIIVIDGLERPGDN